MKPGIIFRGSGKRLSDELKHYDPRVAVFFQKHAWADRVICNDWGTNIYRKNLGIKNLIKTKFNLI